MRLTQAGEKEGTAVHPFYIGDYPLQDVNSFPYLGSIITPENDMTEELNMRIGRARGVFFKLTKRLWNQRGIRKETKAIVSNAVVASTYCMVLEHGLERSIKLECLGAHSTGWHATSWELSQWIMFE